ncbi:MAG: helix-turn-helix domain-containing protein [Candidatus Endonucleobacter sp. (ex Gigantidas childressi)]|nr:helix-turn-helix domain-containing protein [Candidatus Endonucleobacter sp. (ex Gigantidas childressi)]
MTYQQLTEGDRYMIVALKWQGLSFTDIATATGKHRSTIYQEFQRNTCWHKDGSYLGSSELAHLTAQSCNHRELKIKIFIFFVPHIAPSYSILFNWIGHIY